MKARVNENCIGCGLCASLCPDVFVITPEGIASARRNVPVPSEEVVREAADTCPVAAIELEGA